MPRAIGIRPLGNTWDGKLWIIRQVHDVGRGEVTLSRTDGKVATFTASGILTWKPAGSDGPEQRCILDGNLAIFRPKRAVIFVVACPARIPR